MVYGSHRVTVYLPVDARYTVQMEYLDVWCLYLSTKSTVYLPVAVTDTVVGSTSPGYPLLVSHQLRSTYRSQLQIQVYGVLVLLVLSCVSGLVVYLLLHAIVHIATTCARDTLLAHSLLYPHTACYMLLVVGVYISCGDC